MDHTTVDLMSAVDFLLRHSRSQAPAGFPDRWQFQEGSEVHLALTEALAQARIALGIDVPEFPAPVHVKEAAA